jgi:type II secretory pathway component GspD/PulD (secretin)
MVFLKPTVVRGGAATSSLTADRYEYLMGEQQRLRPDERPLWPDPTVPQLPALPPAGAGGAPQSGTQPRPQ